MNSQAGMEQLEIVCEENFQNPNCSRSQRKQGVAIVKGSKKLIWLLQNACLVQLINRFFLSSPLKGE